MNGYGGCRRQEVFIDRGVARSKGSANQAKIGQANPHGPIGLGLFWADSIPSFAASFSCNFGLKSRHMWLFGIIILVIKIGGLVV
jgi:hypothetical protein